MKKTLIGILIMAVAIMMTLSGAVFAAEVPVVTADKTTVEKGETVKVTVKHPSGTSSFAYDVTYGSNLKYTGSDEAVNNLGGNKLRVADASTSEVPSYTLTFVGEVAGTTQVSLSNTEFVTSDENGNAVEIETGAATPLSVTIAEKAEEPAPSQEPQKPAEEKKDTNSDATTGNNEKKSDETKTTGDKKVTIKDKLGFDGMYIVYLVAAVLAAAGIVTVAKRK